MESPYQKINPSPMEMHYHNTSLCSGTPRCRTLESWADGRLTPCPKWQHNSPALAEMLGSGHKGGWLGSHYSCPVMYVLNQQPAYWEPGYNVVEELRTLVKGRGISSHHPKLPRIYQCCMCSHTPQLVKHNEIIPTAMQFAVWRDHWDLRTVYDPGRSTAEQKPTSHHCAADQRGCSPSPCTAGRLPVWWVYHHSPRPAGPTATPRSRHQF